MQEIEQVELTPEAKAYREQEKQKNIKERKHIAVDKDVTIVFAMRGPDEHGNYAITTLENPYMLISSGSKIQTIKNAFTAYIQALEKSSGDSEVSQSTTSKT